MAVIVGRLGADGGHCGGHTGSIWLRPAGLPWLAAFLYGVGYAGAPAAAPALIVDQIEEFA